MGRQQINVQQVSRPKRKATNSHIFRYLQTRNPSRLEENDLKKALEASLEECPEDSASGNSSSSDQGYTNSSTENRRRRSSSASSQPNHPNCHSNGSITANPQNCPMTTVHNRYKPVAKKNIYDEADFFHEGIMEYIEYELHLALVRRQQDKTKQC